MGTFSGSIQVLMSRPAFNSSYNSLVFNFMMKMLFFLIQETHLFIMPKNAFRDNLSSILSFYALFMIGLDYDTFSPNGGTPLFPQRHNCFNAQTGAAGWKASETGRRNRYWLVDNALQQLLSTIKRLHGTPTIEKELISFYDDKNDGSKGNLQGTT